MALTEDAKLDSFRHVAGDFCNLFEYLTHDTDMTDEETGLACFLLDFIGFPRKESPDLGYHEIMNVLFGDDIDSPVSPEVISKIPSLDNVIKKMDKLHDIIERTGKKEGIVLEEIST
jgi:hypothetical protein